MLVGLCSRKSMAGCYIFFSIFLKHKHVTNNTACTEAGQVLVVSYPPIPHVEVRVFYLHSNCQPTNTLPFTSGLKQLLLARLQYFKHLKHTSGCCSESECQQAHIKVSYLLNVLLPREGKNSNSCRGGRMKS